MPKAHLALVGDYSPEVGAHQAISYGLSPKFVDRLASGPLRVAARDIDGDVRAIELDGHPFFVATLYQPERSGLAGRPHPLIGAFVDAARGHAAARRR